jgi:hypothetical protein
MDGLPTESEMIADLRRIFEEGRGNEEDGGFMTTSELSRASGLPPRVIRKMLRVADEDGKLDCRLVQRFAIGRLSRQSVPGYRIKHNASQDSDIQ